MIEEVKKNSAVLFTLLLGVILHIVYMNTPLINYEWSFLEVVRSLTDPSYSAGFVKYWQVQANPIGYSIITAFFVKIFNMDVSYWVMRLPSLTGLILIILSGFIIYKELQFDKKTGGFFYWTALIIFSPMIWIFSGRATADVFPVGLLCLSFAMCLEGKRSVFYYLISSLCLGLAIIVKYNSGLFVFGLLYLVFVNNKEKINKALIFKIFLLASLSSIIVAGYLYYSYSVHNVLIMPAVYAQRVFKTTRGLFYTNFVNYISFIGLLLGPIGLGVVINILLKINKKGKIIYLSAIGIFVLLSLISFSRSAGEMNYGSFDFLLPRTVLLMINLMGAVIFISLFFHLIYHAVKERSKISIFFLFSVVPYLIMISFSRPAQRYLLYLLPFLIFYTIFFIKTDKKILKWLVVLTLIPFIIASGVSTHYQISKARAAENMVEWIQKKDLMNDVYPDYLYIHGGHHFPLPDKKPKKYTVIESTKDPEKKIIHKEEVRIFGKLLMSFYLIGT
ncbi:MAG: glycosyltransferase family 39 protein [Spirochaetes bacterium]|nr:glycosyltransferase family 39 protein [Spirochaetota bacterium]